MANIPHISPQNINPQTLPISITHTNTISGNSTTWSQLENPMEIKFKIQESKNILIMASFSRIQHNNVNSNTELRIICNGNQLAVTNTGNAEGWNYRNAHIHCIVSVNPGEYNVSVQYKTQRGFVHFYNNEDGQQERKLTIVTI